MSMKGNETRIASIIADPRTQKMARAFSVERATLDETARTVELSFASENPVERWFGMEVLEVSDVACDLSRLNNGGAVLLNHEWDDQVGVVIRAWIDAATKKARCIVKFSRSACGEDIFQDIKDGIRSLVSVGYIVRKMVLQSVEGDMETHRVTDWQPYEVSVVAVPADTSVGVGRSQPTEIHTHRQSTNTHMATEATPAAPSAPIVTLNESDIRTAALATERTRAKDINAAAAHLITRHPKHTESLRALAAKCVETGDNVDAFNRSVLADILATTETRTPGIRQDANAATLNLSSKDRKRYSLMRAINLAAAGKPLDGLEAECSVEMSRKLDRPAQGFFVPDEILLGNRAAQRGLSANINADGGYTVGTDIMTNELVELLRNQSKVIGLGARLITGLTGNVSIPRQLTGAAAYWVAEGASITQSSATFGQIWGKPRRIGTSVPYSKEFLAQTSLSAESFVRDDSMNAIGVELDRVAINGTGGSQPLGILNLASGERSTSVSFGAAPTWAKYVDFWTQVATNNALLGNPAYLTTPASVAKAMTVQKFATYGDPILKDGKIGVYPAEWSNQFPSSGTLNQVIFGDFSQVLFLEWAGYDIVVDPFSGKKEGTVEITIQRLMDMIIRRSKSFSISSDSGAQ